MVRAGLHRLRSDAKVQCIFHKQKKGEVGANKAFQGVAAVLPCVRGVSG